MTSRIIAITVDCRDSEPLARFWCEALGYSSSPSTTGSPGRTACTSTSHRRPDRGDDEVRRLLSLGAHRLSDDPNVPWVVLADPEGNEFCVLPEGGADDGTTA